MERRRVLSALCGTLPLSGCLFGSEWTVEGADTAVTDRRCVDGAASDGTVRFDGRTEVVVSGDLLLYTQCDEVNVNVFTSNAERERGQAIVEVAPIRPRDTDSDCEDCRGNPVCTYESRITFSDRVVGIDMVHTLPGGGGTSVASRRRE